MTRVRMCEQHPDLIVRHHVFEDYPQGITPDTTAPLDYLTLHESLKGITKGARLFLRKIGEKRV